MTVTVGEMEQLDASLPAPPGPVSPGADPGVYPLGQEYSAPGSDPAETDASRPATIVAPPPRRSFAGLNDDGTPHHPSAQGAAGPDHLVSILDRGFAVFDKATGSVVSGPISLQAFWAPLGTGAGEPAFEPFDPRILFDQFSRRWIVTAASNSRSPFSSLLVAISESADPRLGFTLFAIPADQTGATWAGSPGLGLDPDHVTITANRHAVGSNDLVGSRAWILDKEPVLSGGALVVHEFTLAGGGWRPAHAIGPTPVNYMVSAGWSPGGTTRFARILEVSYSAVTPEIADIGFIQLADYGFSSPAEVPQAGCAEALDTEAFRLGNAVLRGGRIWTVHTVDTPPGLGEPGKAEIAWYEIDPRLASPTGPFPSPLRQGRIRDNELHFFNPSIAVNVDETVAFGFSGAGAGHFAGAYFAIRQPADPPDMMPAVRLAREGASAYLDAAAGAGNRWGNSSATVLDPDDNRTFWTLQEYAEPETAPGCPTDATGSWGTWWTSFGSCTTGADCNDGLFCNGAEACDGPTGHCLAGEAMICPDDGQICTIEVCNEELDSCNTPAPDDETAAGPDDRCSSPDDNPSLYGPDAVCDTADDGFGDGVCNPIDNCTALVNPDQADLDADGRGDACDNCPASMNFAQQDRDADGAGDACQPFVSIAGFLQDGSDVVHAETVLFDPQGQPLSGEIEVTVATDPVVMDTLYPDFDCSKWVPLDAPGGPAMVYFTVSGKSSLQDAAGFACPAATGSVEFGLGRCDDAGLVFQRTGVDLTGLPVPFDLCVRPVLGPPEDARQFSVTAFDPFTLTLVPIEAIRLPYTDSTLPSVTLPAPAPGRTVRVALSASDGVTPAARDSADFVSLGESLLVFRLNANPVADAGPDQVIDCAAATGAAVVLDGTASRDPDSTSGNDDIVLFEWIENADTAAETLLGIGDTLTVNLAPGPHDITLKVTDTMGAIGIDHTLVTVVESAGPDITLGLTPALLWPPNHRVIDVDAALQIDSACPMQGIELVSVTSDEPDDSPATGDGRTVNDIQAADPGTPDLQIRLRAERDSGGDGRTYTVTYRAVDAAGKTATATATVSVPRDLGGITEPVMLTVRENGAGTVVEWDPVTGASYYNLARGGVRNLNDAGDHYDLGPVSCLAARTTSTTTLGFEDPDLPPVGEAFFYLVEYNDGLASSFGTSTAAKERLAAPGPGACP